MTNWDFWTKPTRREYKKVRNNMELDFIKSVEVADLGEGEPRFVSWLIREKGYDASISNTPFDYIDGECTETKPYLRDAVSALWEEFERTQCSM